MDWFFTLYSKIFKPAVVRIFWDIGLIFGPHYTLRIGFSLFSLLREQMMSQKMHDGYSFVRAETKELKVSQILEVVFGGEEGLVTEGEFHEAISGMIFEKLKERRLREEEELRLKEEQEEGLEGDGEVKEVAEEES